DNLRRSAASERQASLDISLVDLAVVIIAQFRSFHQEVILTHLAVQSPLQFFLDSISGRRRILNQL
ncbi:MAG: hypothetical protein AAFN63_15100, partial [Pseudomonadota bacterium]